MLQSISTQVRCSGLLTNVAFYNIVFMGFLVLKISAHVEKSFSLYIEMIYRNYQSNFTSYDVLFTRILASFFLRKTTLRHDNVRICCNRFLTLQHKIYNASVSWYKMCLTSKIYTSATCRNHFKNFL